ncbi:hypothetical protein GCM10023196_100120 [Actinoallomurus vinaceus]|uniref:Uncharacterized protein n=1 Tax=Actinoallomurus vinaceus TaxID=1080074 RepID=A0ABP8UT84_9ACTN
MMPANGRSEPLVDRRDVEGGLVTNGELVIASRDCSVALEPVDRALHGMTVAVVGLVELGRSPTTRAPLEPVRGLVLLLGDGALIPRPRR